MEDTNSQAESPEPSIHKQGMVHEKVLQPSAAFIEELKSAQSTPSIQPPQPLPQTSDPQPAFINQPHQSNASIGSIYPEATKGVGVAPPGSTTVVPSTEPSSVDKKVASKIIIVKLVALVLIAINIINAYDWYLETKAGYTSWLSIAEIIIWLLVTVGIFRLSEAARIFYVFISVILIALSCINITLFYINTRAVVTATTPTTKQLIRTDQLAIASTEKSRTLTAAEKQRIDQELQRNITNLSGSKIDVKLKQYISEGLLLLVGIGPLIFLTRPSIKSVFQ